MRVIDRIRDEMGSLNKCEKRMYMYGGWGV